MAYPATIDSPDASMQGTTLVTTDDHSLQHRIIGTAIPAIENVLGTTNGTSVLKSFNTGDFAVRMNNGGTLQQSISGTLTNTTFNNGTLGTATLTGGTANNVTLGTPTLVLGSDAQGDLYYRSSGGAVNRLGAGTIGQFLQTGGAAANPSWVGLNGTPISGTASNGTTASITFVDISGGSVSIITTVKTNIYITAQIQCYANNVSAVEYLGQIIDGSSVVVGLIPQISLITGNRRQQMPLGGIQTGKVAGTYTYKLQQRNTDGTTVCTAEQAIIQVSAIPV